jgi:hypothetical protein
MILSAGDLALEIDFGRNQPGAILQRKERDGYQDYLIDGKSVTNPFDVDSSPPGSYRLREK